jgi:nucleoside-diphosphate-sugar epimerase
MFRGGFDSFARGRLCERLVLMPVVLFTGFPGFLGSELLPRVLDRSPEYRAACLVQSKFIGLSRLRVEEIERSFPHLRGRVELAVGDITAAGLGLEDSSRIRNENGPYCVIRWLLRQPCVAVLPLVGNPASTQVNIVPRDYVVDAISYLSAPDASRGKVYQLCDPAPLTVGELVEVIGRATRRRVIRVPVPHTAAKFLIDRVPGVYRLMQIPSPAIDYFVHPTRYTCRATLADLDASPIRVPPLPTYIDRLVDVVRRHPRIGSAPMN